MFWVPFASKVLIAFSGIPVNPKPPNMSVDPLGTSEIAANAFGKTLFMGGGVGQ
jgi:hypothetical protein